MNRKTSRPQHAYLLRCWQEKAVPGEPPRWRFSVEEVLHEGPRQGFNSLDALLAYLQAELARQSCPAAEADRRSDVETAENQ